WTRKALRQVSATRPTRMFFQTTGGSFVSGKQSRRGCFPHEDYRSALCESPAPPGDLETDAAAAPASNVHGPTNANRNNHRKPDAALSDFERRRDHSKRAPACS